MTKVHTSGRRKRAPRGAHIVDREAADKALAKRLREERRQEALEEARAEQARLERRIEREKVEPAMGPALGAAYSHHEESEPELVIEVPTPEPPRLCVRFPDLPWEGDGSECHAIGQARAMLRQGYNIRKVVSTFNIGLKWFDDIPIDSMGFGTQEEH